MKKLIFILLSIIFFTACEREEDFILEGPNIVALFDGENQSTQEPGRSVLLDFNVQAANGLQSLVITQNDEQTDVIHYTHAEISSSYQFEYYIATDTPLGTEKIFVFTLSDQTGKSTSYTYKLNIDGTFSEVEEEVNGKTVVRIKGVRNYDYEMTADKTYLVDSTFVMESNSKLTIEKGSTIYFKTYDAPQLLSKLVIARGSQMEAIGTSTEPIVFTSDKLLTGEQPGPTDWGGIFMYGQAPTNQGSDVLGDGFRYGGTIPNDNSGALRYVRIEYAGKNGAHGLYMLGVGSATLIEYVQVWQNENISFRIKGGRVNLKYIAGIEHGGYGIWAEHGWQGNGQFWIFQTSREATLVPVNFWNQARSIEMRNDENNFSRSPQTIFRIANVTIIGNGYQENVDNGSRRGVRIRRGAFGQLHNMIVTEFPNDGVRIEDLDVATFGNTMNFSNTRVFNNQSNFEQDAPLFVENPANNISDQNVSGIGLNSFVGSEAVNYNPTVMGSFFTNAPYIGAVESATNDWTAEGNWFKNPDGTIR